MGYVLKENEKNPYENRIKKTIIIILELCATTSITLYIKEKIHWIW